MRVCREDKRSFDAAVGLRQGCVIWSWLFKLSMDGALRKWMTKIMNACACFKERDGIQCRVSSSLFADDATVIADESPPLTNIQWHQCVVLSLSFKELLLRREVWERSQIKLTATMDGPFTPSSPLVEFCMHSLFSSRFSVAYFCENIFN